MRAGADSRAKGQALFLHSGSGTGESERHQNLPVACQLAGAWRKASTIYARDKRATRQDTTTMTLEAGYDFDVLNVSMIPRTAAATTRRRRAGTVVASRHTQV